jgi:hypothetical protein
MQARFRDLGAPARLAVFVAALALIGGVAALAGAATGHGRAAPPAHGGDAGMQMETHTSAAAHTSEAAQSRANGLASTAAGYTFVPERSMLPLARQSIFRFRILDPRGAAVRKLDLDGGAPGEIVFQTELSAAGRYRLFLQFKVGDVVHTAPFTLGVQR